jgi:PAS domain S-box-containing protein
MQDEDKTKEQLIAELHALNQRLAASEENKEEGKRAEEALRESEECYKALFERSLDCVFLTDFEGHFLDANQAALDLLDYQREDIYRLTFASLLPADQLHLAFQTAEEIRSTGCQKSPTEFRLRRKDGEAVFVETQSSLIYRAGKPFAIQGIARDITARKRMEEELFESENKFKSFAEYALVGIYLIQDGAFKYVNPKFAQMFGYTVEECLSDMPFKKLVYAEDLTKVEEQVQRRTSGEGEFTQYTFRGVKKSGQIFHVEIHGSASVHKGKPAAMGTLLDISERKWAEDALRERDIQFKKLSSHVPGMIYQFMKRLDGTYCMPFTTEAIKGIFGCSPQDVREDVSPVTRVILAEDFDKLIRSIESSAERMTAWQCEYRVQIPGRPIRWMLGHSTPEQLADGSIIWHGFNTDITDRKRAEEILSQTEENFRRSLEESPLGVRIVTIEGETIYANPAILSIYGFDSIEELKTTPAKKRYTPESYADFQIRREKREQGECDPSDYEISIVRKDGEVRHLRVIRKEILWDGERQFQVIYQDITERKQAEEAVRESERKFHSVFDAMSELVVLHELICDSTGRPIDYRILDCNPAFTRSTGIPAERAIGALASQLYDTGEPPYLKSYAHVALTGQPMQFEAYFAPMQKYLAISAVSPAEGRFATVSTDITDHKLAEEKLQFRNVLLSTQQEVSIDGILVVDEEARIISYNRRFVEMWGIPAKLVEDRVDEPVLQFVTAQTADPCSFLQRVQYLYKHRQETSRDELMLADSRVFDRYSAPMFGPGERYYGRVCYFRDITERKRAEEALISANQQLNDIIEFLPDATAVIDKDKKFIAWNRAMEEMTGVSKAEMIGKGHQEGAVPFYGERRPYLLDLIDASSHVLESRYPYVKKKGNTLYAETYVPCIYEGRGAHVFAAAAPLFDSQSNVIGAIESIRDITEYKETEEALREFQRRLEDIINFLPDATLVIDEEGRVIAWNRPMEELTEVKAEDILGKGDYEYALPFYGKRRPILIDLALRPQAEVEEKYMKVERRDSVLTGEAHMPALRGGGVYLFCKASILRDSKGNIVGAIESMHDITGRRRAEESLARAEEKYRSIFENAMEGIYQTTLEGRCINANPALAKILGYDSPEELMNTLTDISEQLYVNPERRTELLRLIEQYGSAREFETQYFQKDRSFAWVSLNMHAVRDKNGKVAYLEGTVQDITDRKALESRLIQAHKMEAIGTLAGGVAHDFNNILAAIMGYSEIIKVKFDEPALHPYVEQILASSERAKSLVGQILTFCRATEQEKRPIDMTTLIGEGLKLLRAILPATIAIRQAISSGTHTVLADPTQIHQVLMNLCTNAAHAMRERGGVIEVGLENLEVTRHATTLDLDITPGPYVKLRVSDTGTGIAPQVIHRIFDPFFTTKKTGEGTGLGLSVVYGIVKGSGGTVTVQSEPGVGSVFSVYLPAITDVVQAKLESGESIPKGNERILLVDDEEVLAKMWCDILMDLGYMVTATTESTNALEICRNGPDQFDLVITDMTMPGLTGTNLSKEILRLRPDMPIILCTGFNELVTEEKAKAMGIREFAMKPLNLRSFAVLIRKALEKK